MFFTNYITTFKLNKIVLDKNASITKQQWNITENMGSALFNLNNNPKNYNYKYQSGATTHFRIDCFDIYIVTPETIEQVLCQAEKLKLFWIVTIRWKRKGKFKKKKPFFGSKAELQ